MQAWADYIDQQSGANVAELPPADAATG